MRLCSKSLVTTWSGLLAYMWWTVSKGAVNQSAFKNQNRQHEEEKKRRPFYDSAPSARIINKKTPLPLLCSLSCAGEEKNLLSNVCLGFFGADAMLFWQIMRKPENHAVKMSQASLKPLNFYLERGILVWSVRTPKTVKIRIDFNSKLWKGCITRNFNVFFLLISMSFFVNSNDKMRQK